MPEIRVIGRSHCRPMLPVCACLRFHDQLDAAVSLVPESIVEFRSLFKRSAMGDHFDALQQHRQIALNSRLRHFESQTVKRALNTFVSESEFRLGEAAGASVELAIVSNGGARRAGIISGGGRCRIGEYRMRKDSQRARRAWGGFYNR